MGPIKVNVEPCLALYFDCYFGSAIVNWKETRWTKAVKSPFTFRKNEICVISHLFSRIFPGVKSLINQLSLLFSGLYASVYGIISTIRLLIPYSRKNALPMACGIILVALLNKSRGKVMKLLNPRQAPADVITIAEGRKS